MAILHIACQYTSQLANLLQPCVGQQRHVALENELQSLHQ